MELDRLFTRELDMSIRNTCMSALFAMLILLTTSSQAQEPEVPSHLTIEAVIRLAIDRNPYLAAAKYEIQALEGDRIAASKRPNLAFSLESENFPLRANPGSIFDTQEITSRVDFEIETGGRRKLRTEAAGQALEGQQFAHRNQMRLLRLEVEREFFRIILAKSNLEASKLILEQAERTISLNRVRFQQGDISALDLNRIEVETLKFQEDVFQSDLALRNAKSSLLALLNEPDLSRDVDAIGALPIGDQDSEPGLPPRVPLEQLIQIALKQRPDMAARLHEKLRADTETRLQRAMRSPNITIGGGYKRNAHDNAVVFGVSIPLKVFNRNEGEIIRADAEQMRASSLTAAVQREIQLEVQHAYNAVEINRQRVDYIRTQQLKRAEESSRVTLESYNLGGATLIDYLDAQRTYRDALRIFNQALFDERISLYELSSSIALGVQ
jgi:outer membrane protein, heavy metal efflux system